MCLEAVHQLQTFPKLSTRVNKSIVENYYSMFTNPNKNGGKMSTLLIPCPYLFEQVLTRRSVTVSENQLEL